MENGTSISGECEGAEAEAETGAEMESTIRQTLAEV